MYIGLRLPLTLNSEQFYYLISSGIGLYILNSVGYDIKAGQIVMQLACGIIDRLKRDADALVINGVQRLSKSEL
jgi:hypothetical protein